MKTMDKIAAVAKGRGFIFGGSEIYGGLQSTWDYGPLGVELKNNIKKAWWKKFVQECHYNIGLDASILMNPKVWVASGHVGGFSDPLMDCRACKERFRADKVIDDFMMSTEPDFSCDGLEKEQLKALVDEHKIPCPTCGKHDFTDIREFNLMFKTHSGVTEDSQSVVYLRPETAQGIFVNFKNAQRTSRKKVPFGIAQIGKAFRNEITPGNYIFRTREFEQMELEFFCHPNDDEKWYEYWLDFCKSWLLGLGVDEASIRMMPHPPEKLSHYAKACTDIEFKFPFGWGELWGIANRTDFDLTAHSKGLIDPEDPEKGKKDSLEDMTYQCPETNEKYIPYVIEPSLGVDRLMLAILCNAYDEEEISEGDVRTVLRLHPALAPVKAAVLPLSNKLKEKATEIYDELCKHFPCDLDTTGSIGKRYRRFDEIGTPFCITIDFQTVGDDETPADHAVTVRFRDSMEQVRVPVAQLTDFIAEKLVY
ncbi:MAG: glycine--tRNA ligase [Defluviitaleaceae bacterium]|nr:glycine--tRNA ligase [Defluviitaleaceae bacterium]